MYVCSIDYLMDILNTSFIESSTIGGSILRGTISKRFSFWKCYFDKQGFSNMDEPHFVSYFTFHTAFKNTHFHISTTDAGEVSYPQLSEGNVI